MRLDSCHSLNSREKNAMSTMHIRTVSCRALLGGLLVLMASAWTRPSHASSSESSCQPSPPILEAIESLDSEAFERMPPAKRQAARIERLRVLLRENPQDLFLHREVQKRSR